MTQDCEKCTNKELCEGLKKELGGDKSVLHIISKSFMLLFDTIDKMNIRLQKLEGGFTDD